MRHALTLALLFAAACDTQPQEAPVPGYVAPSGDTVMTINGDITISQSEYDAIMARFPAGEREAMQAQPDAMKRFHDSMAMSQILYKRALEANLQDGELIQTGLRMTERDFLAAMYVTQMGDDAVTDEAVQALYDERQVQFAQPEVKASLILVTDESLANDLKGQLDGGADFAALAQQHSVEPNSKAKGGDVGWFQKRSLEPNISEAVFAAEKGQIVGPLEGRMGYFLVRVDDTRASRPLDDVRPQLEAELRQQAQQKMLAELQANLKVEMAGEAAPAEGEAAPAAPAAPAAGGHGPGDGHNHE